MMETLFITGHKNPDTDSICAALAYANLKNELGQGAIPVRIGDLNVETQYVLDRFKADPPVLLDNAKSRIRDIEFDQAIKVLPDMTLQYAWDKINGTKNKSLVVVDKDEHLLGVASMSSLSNVLMLDCNNIRFLMSHTPIENICEVIEGTIVYKPENYATNGRVIIPYSLDELDYNEVCSSIILVGNDLKTQRRLIKDKIGCLIVVNDYGVSDEVIELAKQNNVAIIKTGLDSIHIARKIYLAPPVSLIMVENPITVNINEYVDESSKRMAKSRYRSYPVVDDYGHVIGAISRYHLFKYRKKKFILVDHNEVSQTIDNIEDADIVEIVDHHRIGDIETGHPINFRNQNLGSTCSIIYLMYKENGIKPSKQMASLMLSAIVSDTMNFNSPTTTSRDQEIAHELAAIAKLNIDEFALELFGAVATIKGRTNSEILYNDFKEYVIEGQHIGIGQVNIMNIEELYEIKDDFMKYLEKINSINKYDLLLMCFTNVLMQGSTFIACGKLDYIIDEAFNKDKDADYVAGYVSRKKQIIPALMDALRR